MKKFRIEQYETHSGIYEVMANNKAEAIKKVLDGEQSEICETEYIEVNEDLGMPIENLTPTERKILGCQLDYIPSIRSVEEAKQ